MDKNILIDSDFPSIGDSMVSPIKIKKIRFFYFFIIFVVTIVIGRLVWLQIIKGSEYRNISEGNRTRIERIKAIRGLIYDSSGRPLVKNIARFSLLIVPQDLPAEEKSRDKIFRDFLAKTETINKDVGDKLREQAESARAKIDLTSFQPIIIAKNLDYQTALRLRLITNNLPGFSIGIRAQRNYLYGPMLSHILGYVAPVSKQELLEHPEYSPIDLIGRTGLELYYEEELKGKDGQKKIEVNALGRAEKIVSQTIPVHGQDIILTIDLDLQKYVYKILKKYIKLANSHAGTIIVSNPSNGEILSMVSYPSYDNNIFIQNNDSEYKKLSQDPDKPFIFRALVGEYPPGSIIKPLLAIAGLSEGIITPQTNIFSDGGIRIGQWFFPDWKRGGHGNTDVIKALAESVNTFFYYLGGGFKDFKGLGPQKIREYLSAFGLTKKTGIDLPGEKSGFIATPEWKKNHKNEPWYIGDTYHLSIGQGDILVTPLQVACYTMALANNGTLFVPRIVKKFQDPADGAIKNKPLQIVDKDLFNAEYFKLIKKGMREAVLRGSARQLNDLSVKVAGKTGTAQLGGDKTPHAWFIGFAPYDNPKIALTILIENGGEGSAIAIPAAKEIFSFLFAKDK
ncbi:penicillin-binding protein 2 [Candidatus Parcubacteria bacterium 4484_255]|nr:MAG: penicillin-binding protein 2 [Candidatus Parcubacteria bacterium 4484_255]